MNKINTFIKKYFKVFIIVYLLFIFLMLGNLYLNIKTGKFSKKVNVILKCNVNTFNSIKAYRVSPSNFVNELVRDNKLKTFLSKNGEYLKRIKIEVPKKEFEYVEGITIDLGIKKYFYFKHDILKKWKKELTEEIIILYSPENVFYKRSKISFLKNIINWPGDFKVFILTIVRSNIVFFIILTILFFLFKLIKKQIPDGMNKNNYNNLFFSLDDYSKNIISKNYSITNDKYYLNNNINFRDKFELSIIFDKVKNNYYVLLYYIILLFIISFALLQRLSLNKLPYSGNDTWGYIGPAVNWFVKGVFKREFSRSFPYPLFVLINLRIFKDFSYITIVQHLFGIICGLFLIVFWQKVFKNICSNNKIKLFIKFIGLFLLALFLFSESPITIEHDMRPEAIYPFFLILQVIFIYYFVKYFFDKSNLVYVFGILFFVNNYFLFIFQPRWGLTLFFNLIIYFFLLYLYKDKIVKKVILFLIIPTVISMSFLYIPEYVLFKDNYEKNAFKYGTLFWVHSKIIDIEIKKDIKNNNFNKFDKTILMNVNEYMEKVFNEGPSYHKYLGFRFNSFLYGEANKYLLTKLKGKRYFKFCRYYIIKSIMKHPLLYSKKVLLELSQFYNFNGGMYTKRIYKRDYEEYKYSYNIILEKKVDNIIFLNYLNQLKFYEDTTYDFPKIRFPYVKFFVFLLGKTYIWCLLLFIVLFLYKIKKGFIDNKLFILGLVILLIYFYNFFISLTVAVTFFFDINRYIDDQFILLLISQFLTIVFFVLNKEVFIEFINFLKKNRQDER